MKVSLANSVRKFCRMNGKDVFLIAK